MRDWVEQCKNDWERCEQKFHNLFKVLETNWGLLGRLEKGPNCGF